MFLGFVVPVAVMAGVGVVTGGGNVGFFGLADAT